MGHNAYWGMDGWEGVIQSHSPTIFFPQDIHLLIIR